MAAPAWVGNGNKLGPANRTNSVVDPPTSVATGDIILVFIYIESTTAVTPPSGFTAIGTPVFTNSNTGGRVFWKRAVGDGTDDNTDTYTFTHSNAFTEAIAMHFSGCVASGSPIDVSTYAKNDTASAITPGVSVTTTGADRLLVWHATSISSGNWNPPGSYTERYDGLPGELAVADLAQAVAGSSGSITAGSNPNNKMTAGLLALIPAVSVTTLTATGIASAQAMGSHDITVDDVEIAVTGIPTPPLPFGSHTVSPKYNIAATGIPSAQAFGLADLTNGIRPNSIPSAQAFGSATVSPGPATVSPSGIPSGQAFGTAVLLGSVLYPLSIDTATVFGTAAITTGPVTLSPAGIPSQLEIGSHIVSQFVIALTSEILVRPRTRTTYEIVWMSKIPQASGPPSFFAVDPIDWTSISYTEECSAIPTLSFTCQISTISDAIRQRFREPSEMATEIWVYRNGRLIFAGPLAGATIRGEDLNFTADGLMTYLDRMIITSDTVFKQVDQFTIIKTLIDTKQTGPYSNYGISTANIGLSGTLIDVTYLKKENNYILPKILTLSNSANGFDIMVNPSSRQVELYSPFMGVDRSSGPEAVVFDDKDLTDTNIVLSLSPKDLASDIIGVGTGTGPDGTETYTSTFINNDLLTQYGRGEFGMTFRDITSQAQLDALVQAASQARQRPLWIPGVNARVTPNADVSAYNVGDTVFYHLHTALEVKGAFRLQKRTIRVSGAGDETVTASFV